MQTVRVGAHPFSGGLSALRHTEAVLDGIQTMRMARQRMILQSLGLGIAFNIGEGMPAPLAVGSERKPLRIEFGKSLKSGGVKRHGELSVAEIQRMQGVDLGDMRVVPRDEGMSVNFTLPAAGRGEQRN